MTRPRDPYGEVGAHLRATIETAATHHLTALDWRVLAAVIHYTASRSRIGDHVYTAQLADLAYGTDTADEWQTRKTRRTLRHLATLDIIDIDPARGRTGHPDYWVALTAPKGPQPGTPSTASKGSEPGTPSPNGKGPQPGTPSNHSRGPNPVRQGVPILSKKGSQSRAKKGSPTRPPHRGSTEVNRGTTEGSADVATARGADDNDEPAPIVRLTRAQADTLNPNDYQPGTTIIYPEGDTYTVTPTHELEEAPQP